MTMLMSRCSLILHCSSGGGPVRLTLKWIVGD